MGFKVIIEMDRKITAKKVRQFSILGTNIIEMAGKNDKILIEGIKRQDEKMIAEIYNLYFPSVR